MPDLRERLAELGARRDEVATAADEAVALERRWARAHQAHAEDEETHLAALVAARANHATLSVALDAALADAFADVGDDELLGVLDPDVPLVLLPVAIETRFTYVEGRAADLLVRVFPDAIHVENHEPELTDGELELGASHWTAMWRAAGRPPTEAAEREGAAWAMISRALGPARAAWVVAQLTPTNPDAKPTEAVPDDEPLPAAPALPETGKRASGWTRAAVAGTLPDCWLVLAWQSGTSPIAQRGAIIPDRLQVGPSPYRPPDAPPSGEGILEPALRWLVDFDEAEKVGMGIRIKLAEAGVDPAAEPMFRRLAVVGVSASLDADRSSRRLADLVSDHVHTGGFGFLPIGTPTNNTAADSTVWTARPGAETPAPHDPGALPSQANAPIATKALGLDPALLAAVPFADGRDQADADAIQTLLWSATGGYLFDHLWRDDKNSGEIFSRETRTFLRRHFTEYVRARGPLPTLRVGAQPYGLLPATALGLWSRAETEEAQLQSLVSVALTAQDIWNEAVGRVPSVTRKYSPDVLEALGIAPVSNAVYVRAVSGGNRMSLTNKFEFEAGVATRPKISGSNQIMVHAFLSAAGFPKVDFPPLFRAEEARRLWYPLAAPAAGSTDDKVEAMAVFLEGLMSDQLLMSTFLENDPQTLLSVLARYAAVLELALAAEDHERFKRFGKRLVDAEMQVVGTAAVSELQLAPTLLVGLHTEVEGRTIGSSLLSEITTRLPELVTAVNDGSRIAETVSVAFPSQPSTARSTEVALAAGYLAERLRARHRAGEDALGSLKTLVGEALDLWSHRLDAWVTSVATRRLECLRQSKPTGVRLGGYGYVEDLSPDNPPASARDGTDLLVPTHSDGSLLAPSLDQATTAAVLRSGQLTHCANGALAVDLSSARARIAAEIVEGVREGQPLGALIGYRIERRLHDAGAEFPILNAAIPALREAAGFPPGQLPPEPAESITARSVVDGLRLLEHGADDVVARVARSVPLGKAEKRLKAVLAAAQEDIDAVADLLLAESVFQLATGRADRAAATLDALAGRGALPGDPEVLATPRRGAAITSRVLIAVPGTAEASEHGWPTDGPRAEAEPRLDAWAAAVLGNPKRIRFDVATPAEGEDLAALPVERWQPATWPDGAGAPGALDVLALAAASAEPAGGPCDVASSPLLAAVAGAHAAVRPDPQLAPSDEGVTLLELAAVARSAAAVLAAGRSPAPSDLGPSDPTAAATWTEAAARELRSRAQDACDRLEHVEQQLAGEAAPPVGSALVADARSFAITESEAMLAAADADAVAGARSAAERRVARARELLAPPAAPLPLEVDLERSVEAMRALFGPGFRAVPVQQPPAVADLLASIEALFGDGSNAPRVGDWLERAGSARAGAGALADLVLQTNALPGADATSLLAAQIPFRGEPWLGESDPPPELRPIPTALAVHAPRLAGSESIAILVVDEWSEVVPAAEQTAGVAFSYDAPGARAPQAVLLAVHPRPGAAWDRATLGSVIAETADLARARMVDLETVHMMGVVLPALYASQGVVGKVPRLALERPRFEVAVLAAEEA